MKKTAAIIGVAAVFALICYCVRYVQTPVSTLAAYTVTREETINCDAYIVREETVYTAPAAGKFYSYAKEGARVGRNRKICTIYGGSVNEEMLKELGTIDSKIEELSTSVVDSDSFQSDSGSAESRLVTIQQGIDDAAAKNDVAAIAKYKAEIAAIAAGETTGSNADNLEELKRQKAELEANITGTKSDIESTVSGIYSTAVDGFEETLTPLAAKSMTVADFAAIQPQEETKQTPAPDESAAPDEESGVRSVARGERVCKIVDNHEWYVMALVKKTDAADLEVGSSIRIRFGKLPGEETSVTVVSLSNEAPEQEKAVLLLKCDSYSEGAFSIRTSDIELIKKSYSGFQVPVHAVRVVDGQNGVMVRDGGKEVFKPCKVIYKDDENDIAIITPDTADNKKMLTQYDMIVLGEK